jgi:hypothetical protein
MATKNRFMSILKSGGFIIISCVIFIAIVWEFSKIDSGLLRDTTCKAPCWNNLTPGQTTPTELDQYLSTLSLWTWLERRTFTYETGCRWTRFSKNTIPGVMDFFIENEKLTYIELWGHMNGNLGKVVDRYGPPESIEVILAIGIDGDNYIFEVFYPSKGFAISLYTDYEDRGYIKSNMQIWTVEYFSPGDLLSYLTTKYSCSFGHDKAVEMAKKEIENFAQPWPGFGEVKPTIDDWNNSY